MMDHYLPVFQAMLNMRKLAEKTRTMDSWWVSMNTLLDLYNSGYDWRA